MSEAQDDRRVRLDLNNPEFQERLFALDKAERNRTLPLDHDSTYEGR